MMIATCLIAAVSMTGVLLWQDQRHDAEVAHKDAGVRQAAPVIALAVKAKLAQIQQSVFAESLRKHEEPRAHFQFIAAAQKAQRGGKLFGADFTWQGTKYLWPTNPFTGRAMKQGTGAGDFTCQFTWWGSVSGTPDSFTLVVYGHDGKALRTLSSSSPPVPIG